MKCPNKSLPEWKEMVKQYDEDTAYAAYVMNNFEVPTMEQINGEDLNPHYKKAEVLKRLDDKKDRIEEAIKITKSKYKYSDNKSFQKSIDNLLNDIVESDTKKSLFSFLDKAGQDLTNIVKNKLKTSGDLKSIQQLETYMGLYNYMDNVKEMFSDLESLGYEFTTEEEKYIDQQVAYIDKLFRDFSKVSKDIKLSKLAETFAKRSTRMEDDYREKFRKKYVKENPKPKGTKEAKDAWERRLQLATDEYVSNNSMMIYNDSVNYYKTQLTTAPKDIKSFDLYFTDTRGINEPVIQAIDELLDRSTFEAKELFEDDYFSIINDPVIKKFLNKSKKRTGLTDMKEVYKGMYEEQGGKPTGYMVDKYYNSAINDLLDAKRSYYQKSEGYEEKLQKMGKKYLRKGTGKGGDYWTRDFKPSNLKDEFKNPQWDALQKDAEKLEVFKKIKEFNSESDGLVPHSYRLKNRIPVKTNEGVEKLKDRGYIKGTVGNYVDNFVVTVDDTDFAKDIDDDSERVLTDEQSKEVKKITLPFRAPIDPSKQSFDLLGRALDNRYVSRNHNEKSKIQYQAEALLDLVAEREVLETRNGKSLYHAKQQIEGFLPKDIRKKLEGGGLASNTHKKIKGIVDSKLYGRKRISAEFKMGNKTVSMNKMADKLTSKTSNAFLIASTLGAANNLTQGKLMNVVMSYYEGALSPKDLAAADVKYWKHIDEHVKDIGALYQTGTINLLSRKFFEDGVDYSGIDNRLSEDTRIKRLANVGTLHGLNHSAEHYIQSTAMLGIMNNIKIQNGKGEYLDKNGKVTSKRSEAMTLDEAYKKDENGRIKPKGDYRIELSNGRSYLLGSESEYIVSRMIKEVIKKAQGNHQQNNEAELQRFWYGKLFFHLKKFLIPGYQRRYRGLTTAFKDREDLEDHDKFYNQATQQYEEGTYATFARFAWLTTNQIKDTGRLLAVWDELTPYEQGNVKAALMEIGIMMMALASASLVYGLAESEGAEDDDLLYDIAYVLRKQYAETAGFVPGLNFDASLDVIQSPFASLQYLHRWHDFGKQAFGDSFGLMTGDGIERYVSGEQKGDSKLWKKAKKTFIPLLNNSTKNSKDMYNYLVNSIK